MAVGPTSANRHTKRNAKPSYHGGRAVAAAIVTVAITGPGRISVKFPGCLFAETNAARHRGPPSLYPRRAAPI